MILTIVTSVLSGGNTAIDPAFSANVRVGLCPVGPVTPVNYHLF
ncbi:hypothetical protein ACFVR2_19090 [Gottfriedia sp. NPDC057991]